VTDSKYNIQFPEKHHMIQRIRVVAVPCGCSRPNSLLAKLRLKLNRPAETELDEEDLDVLLKFALERSPEAADGKRVWQQITRKVLGPFGSPALEAPAGTALELEMMVSGGRSQPAPFALSDNARGSQYQCAENSQPIWSMLRCVCSGTSQRGNAWLLT
jgi:hypothetical protein